jgi:hypothetical protein
MRMRTSIDAQEENIDLINNNIFGKSTDKPKYIRLK